MYPDVFFHSHFNYLDLSDVMHKVHETFIALAAQLHEIHEAVKVGAGHV